ncbi:hypothetical protein GCK32_013786, partial [Trichostrongylus colubriformis]
MDALDQIGEPLTKEQEAQADEYITKAHTAMEKAEKLTMRIEAKRVGASYNPIESESQTRIVGQQTSGKENCSVVIKELLKINTFHREACLRLTRNSTLIANVKMHAACDSSFNVNGEGEGIEMLDQAPSHSSDEAMIEEANIIEQNAEFMEKIEFADDVESVHRAQRQQRYAVEKEIGEKYAKVDDLEALIADLSSEP